MVKDINLTSDEWCDLIFEGKNKKYGAYYLRKTSNKRHLKAMMIVVISIVIIVLLMIFGSSLKAALAGDKDTITETVKMTSVDLETPKEEQQVVQEKVEPPPPLKAAIKYVVPTVDKNAAEEEDIATNKEVFDNKSIISDKNIEGSDDPNAVDPNTLNKVTEVTAEPVVQKPFEVAEVMPSFPGGDNELMKYLNDNLKYPVVDMEQGTQGRVVLRFVVGVDGTITEVKVVRSVSPTCDKEAIRVVKGMPKWIPGRQNGKPVPVFYSLPVRFKLEN